MMGNRIMELESLVAQAQAKKASMVEAVIYGDTVARKEEIMKPQLVSNPNVRMRGVIERRCEAEARRWAKEKQAARQREKDDEEMKWKTAHEKAREDVMESNLQIRSAVQDRWRGVPIPLSELQKAQEIKASFEAARAARAAQNNTYAPAPKPTSLRNKKKRSASGTYELPAAPQHGGGAPYGAAPATQPGSSYGQGAPPPARTSLPPFQYQ